MDRHFARTFNGNSSPVTTQATGPQELATRLAVRERIVWVWSIDYHSLTEENVDAHKSDSGLLCREVGRSSYGSGDSYDELADGHAGGSHEEKVATAHLFD
jgi:hypothetical protein